MRIALDAMGGDYAPTNTVAGAVMALREYPKITKLFLTGDEQAITAELAKLGFSDPRIEIVHTTQVVEMSDAAVEAVRRKKDSSVSRAVDLVKKGDADAIVSAGHTGAAVAATTIKLRTLEGIERPGIASYLPTEKNVCVLIDAGANIDARPVHLLQYAIMGSVLSEHVLGYKNPEIGLMSIGGEDVKGSEFTKDVFKLLKASSLNFRGNIEGHDLFEHPVEVVLATDSRAMSCSRPPKPPRAPSSVGSRESSPRHPSVSSEPGLPGMPSVPSASGPITRTTAEALSLV